MRHRFLQMHTTSLEGGAAIGEQALELDGVNDYLSISYYPQYLTSDLDTEEIEAAQDGTLSRYEHADGFTVSMWVNKGDCTGGYESLFSQQEDNSKDMHDVTNSNIQVRYGSCAGDDPYLRLNLVDENEQWGRIDARVELTLNLWVQLTLVVNNGVKLYLDYTEVTDAWHVPTATKTAELTNYLDTSVEDRVMSNDFDFGTGATGQIITIGARRTQSVGALADQFEHADVTGRRLQNAGGAADYSHTPSMYSYKNFFRGAIAHVMIHERPATSACVRRMYDGSGVPTTPIVAAEPIQRPSGSGWAELACAADALNCGGLTRDTPGELFVARADLIGQLEGRDGRRVLASSHGR
jgi:hypothetical protein